MKNKYFNEDYFIRILNIIKRGNYATGLREFQKYISQYPNDLQANVFYADLLIRLGKLDEAEEITINAESIINKKTPYITIKEFMILKIKLLCCQKRYEECYELLKENKEYYKSKWMTFKTLLIYLRKKLGKLDVNYYNFDNYLLKQIVFYDENLSIEHIKKRQILTNNNDMQFRNDFPLEEVFYKIRALLPLENRFISNETSDYYIFKYLGNAYLKNKPIDFIKVVTLRDSNEIITMYPYDSKEQFVHLDITPSLEESCLKLQRKSQIEKFNERYKKSGK